MCDDLMYIIPSWLETKKSVLARSHYIFSLAGACGSMCGWMKLCILWYCHSATGVFIEWLYLWWRAPRLLIRIRPIWPCWEARLRYAGCNHLAPLMFCLLADNTEYAKYTEVSQTLQITPWSSWLYRWRSKQVHSATRTHPHTRKALYNSYDISTHEIVNMFPFFVHLVSWMSVEFERLLVVMLDVCISHQTVLTPALVLYLQGALSWLAMCTSNQRYYPTPARDCFLKLNISHSSFYHTPASTAGT